MSLERRQHADKLPSLELKNEVLWVNDRLLTPFDLTEGGACRLGLFLNPGNTSGSLELGIRKGNWRTSDLGKVLFRDTEGRLYRDVDLKGSGLLQASSDGITWAQWHDTAHYDSYQGLWDRESAEVDSSAAEALTALGIRTHRSIAILGLAELPLFDGTSQRTVPIEELIGTGLMTPTFKPVIQLRAFGSKARVDQQHVPNAEFDSVIGLISLEYPEVTNAFEYLHWYAAQLGKNLGLLHKNGYSHGNLSLQNVTLDCRVTDFDTLRNDGQYAAMPWKKRMHRDAGQHGGLLVINRIAASVYMAYGADAVPPGDTLIEEYMDVYESETGTSFEI